MTTPPVPSITDEQLAELERAALAKKSEGFLLVHNLSCNDMLALITRLRAAEADAARYRWLRDKPTFIWLIQDWQPSGSDFIDPDTAIDKAMAHNP